jgi:hypothetical protein
VLIAFDEKCALVALEFYDAASEIQVAGTRLESLRKLYPVAFIAEQTAFSAALLRGTIAVNEINIKNKFKLN